MNKSSSKIMFLSLKLIILFINCLYLIPKINQKNCENKNLTSNHEIKNESEYSN